MLALRPTCEHCNKDLPPNSTEAMICSYECTFCQSCVDNVLNNVCPNCGGGFCKRPIRPAHNHRNNNYLGADPATTTVTFKPLDLAAHEKFSAKLSAIPVDQR